MHLGLSRNCGIGLRLGHLLWNSLCFHSCCISRRERRPSSCVFCHNFEGKKLVNRVVVGRTIESSQRNNTVSVAKWCLTSCCITDRSIDGIRTTIVSYLNFVISDAQMIGRWSIPAYLNTSGHLSCGDCCRCIRYLSCKLYNSRRVSSITMQVSCFDPEEIIASTRETSGCRLKNVWGCGCKYGVSWSTYVEGILNDVVQDWWASSITFCSQSCPAYGDLSVGRGAWHEGQSLDLSWLGLHLGSVDIELTEWALSLTIDGSNLDLYYRSLR